MERMLARLMRRRSLLHQGAVAAAPISLAGSSSLFSTQQLQAVGADPGVLPGLKIRDSASQVTVFFSFISFTTRICA